MRLLLASFIAVWLAGCAKDVGAPDSAIQSVSYSHSSEPSITLMTMVNNKTGAGGHSSLLINGSERVMYDPAGRFTSRAVAERGDVLFGVTPSVLARYKSFHARTTHHVVSQEILVSEQVANTAKRLALKQGASHDAMCAINVSAILSQLPDFQNVSSGIFPKALMQSFGKLPNVSTTKHFEQDVGQN